MKYIYEMAMKGPWETVGDGLQYRIEEIDETLYLLFQYTVSDKDWAYNMDTLPVAYKGLMERSLWLFKVIGAFMKVPGVAKPYSSMPQVWRAHRGFATLYKSGRDEIIKKVMEKNPKKIIISGISQGAALAVLAHEDIWFSLSTLRDNLFTYAFAGPRVFWFPPKALRERLTNVTHVARRGDIVTMLPFWMWGFRHSYKKIKIGKFDLPWWTHHEFKEYLDNL